MNIPAATAPFNMPFSLRVAKENTITVDPDTTEKFKPDPISEVPETDITLKDFIDLVG